jgi:hypothetical protein
MPFRVVRYIVRLWEILLEDSPDLRRLPVVYAVVLHHGRSPWRAPIDLLGLLDLAGLPRRAGALHVPALELLLDDLAAVQPAALAARGGPPLLVATLGYLTKP